MCRWAAGHRDQGLPVIFSEIVTPVAWRFRPQLILVSSGYDAHWDDPLASLVLSVAGYTAIARRSRSWRELC